MKLTPKQKQLVKEYAKNLQSKKLNEEFDDDYDGILTQYTNIVRKAAQKQQKIK